MTEKQREAKTRYNNRVKLKREEDKRKAKLAKAEGFKDLESNKVVYRVKGDNTNYSTYLKAELSTMNIVEINRTIITRR